MFSNYQLFSSGHLPLLAFDEGMLKDLAGMDQNRQRAFVPQLNRSHLLHAWDANKRHLRAISSLRRHPNFGIRKEVTFRLDVILAMWADGALGPDRSPYTGPTFWDVPLDAGAGELHYPFWVVQTKVMTSFVSTQAARLILPLDHIFQEVTRKEGEQPSSSTDPVRQILAFYTAQLFCRLLIYALDDEEEEQNFDNWIWRSVWTVRTRGRGEGSVKERRGLGLGAHINASGMLWIPHNPGDSYPDPRDLHRTGLQRQRGRCLSRHQQASQGSWTRRHHDGLRRGHILRPHPGLGHALFPGFVPQPPAVEGSGHRVLHAGCYCQRGPRHP